MGFVKLPALDEKHAGLRSGCLTCGPQPVTLSLEAPLAVGFGDCIVTKNGEQVYSEMEFNYAHREDEEAEYPTLAAMEEKAAADPDCDWRLWFNGPLSEAEYQRQGDAQWVLIRKGMGFA